MAKKANGEAAPARTKILALWTEMDQEDRELTMLQLITQTKVGQQLAQGGLPFIPDHKWSRLSEASR